MKRYYCHFVWTPRGYKGAAHDGTPNSACVEAKGSNSIEHTPPAQETGPTKDPPGNRVGGGGAASWHPEKTERPGGCVNRDSIHPHMSTGNGDHLHPQVGQGAPSINQVVKERQNVQDSTGFCTKPYSVTPASKFTR